VERENVRVLQVRRNLDFRQKTLGADGNGELGLQHFHRDLAIVFQVLGEIDGGHAACTQLTVDVISVGKCSG